MDLQAKITLIMRVRESTTGALNVKVDGEEGDEEDDDDDGGDDSEEDDDDDDEAPNSGVKAAVDVVSDRPEVYLG